MKVFYVSSTSYKTSEGSEFVKKTINYLGFKVGQKNVKISKVIQPESESSPDEIVKQVKNNEKSLREADIFVADISDSSGGVGFQLAQALQEKKPILALRYKKDSRVIGYGPITSHANKNIQYEEYENEEDITKIIDRFLEDAKSKIDTKFILIIPAEIDRYLSWASDFRRMHKAQVVRKAVETVMQKDKDWKDYLKQRED